MVTGSAGLPAAICLMGPTASGKTDLAAKLCEALPCEVISVDSALIYKGMDIGTAKPDAGFLRKTPHRLIDLIEPWESYSVARFYHDALAAMDEIRVNGKIPLLVGGTMMYFRILRDGIASLPEGDAQIRAQIMQDAQQHGWPFVHAQLRQVDPISAARIKPGDSQRLQRALEVYRISGRTLTEFWSEQARSGAATKETGNDVNPDYTVLNKGLNEGLVPIPYRLLFIGMAPKERSVLHQRIAQRFVQMLEQGLVEEVSKLFLSGKVNSAMPSIRCVGYRQVWDYLEGRLSYSEMTERGIIATRQLAKRQLTWLRSWQELHWLDSCDENLLAQALKIVREAAIK